MRRITRTVAPILFCATWWKLYTFDADKYKALAYNKGRELTLKYGTHRAWNGVVEPFIIRQFGVLFGVGNEFIRGLISDNGNSVATAEAIAELDTTVETELEKNRVHGRT